MSEINGTEGEPLAKFLGIINKWVQGADGIVQVDMRIPPEEKYAAFPMTDRQGQMLQFEVRVLVGAGVDYNEQERKEALKRVLQNVPLRGRMGDGTGEKDNNPARQGLSESSDVKEGIIRVQNKGR